MRGFNVFLLKELREIVRTWRIWVLPLIVVGMAILSPVAARFTPALLKSVAGQQPGVVFEIPEPTTADAYLQWTKNLTQIVLIALVVSMAGMISSERRNGTATLVLTKPVSRAAMVAAKVIGNLILLSGTLAVGTLICWGGTVLLFDGELAGSLVRSSALWLALGALFACLMALLSAVFDSQAGASGVGLVVYLSLAILAGWAPMRDYSPAGLMSAGDRLMLSGEAVILWPLLAALVLGIACFGAAVLVFVRREL